MENEKQKQEIIIFLLMILLVVAVGFLILKNSFLTGEINKVEDSAAAALAKLNGTNIVEPVDKATDPIKGNEISTNKLYVYSSFSCSHCADYNFELTKLLAAEKNNVKIIWKDAISQNDLVGEKAALAARCAQLQGKFWEYHDLLFANQSKLSDQDLLSYAIELNLNTVEFNGCVTSKKTANLVQSSQDEAIAVGVDGTPYTVFNGERLSGVYQVEQLQQLLK